MNNKLISAAIGLAAHFGCVFPAAAQVTVPPGGSLAVPPGGTLSLGCTALNVSGNFVLNSGQVNSASAVAIGSGGSVNGGSGVINISGNWSNAGTFVASTGSVVFSDGCAAGPITISGPTTFNNLTLNSTAGRTFVLPPNTIVNGTLTLQGTPGTPIQLISAGGSAVITLGPGAVVVRSNATVNSNVQIGAVAPPVAAASIPTLSQYALMLLIVSMSLATFAAHRRAAKH